MSLVNTSKPTTTLVNTAKVSASVTNDDRPSFTPLWSATVFPWLLDTPWMTFSEMTNLTKVT
jgi:hypothetical protein